MFHVIPLLLVIMSFLLEGIVAQFDPWINEFHYRPKQNMFIEIAGPANQMASGLHPVLVSGTKWSYVSSICQLDRIEF
jgi:hypothetical protein